MAPDMGLMRGSGVFGGGGSTTTTGTTSGSSGGGGLGSLFSMGASLASIFP
jgi:hypothetical protein